jgi:ATP-binding cassette, subfamily B, bacterial HlyB/CyaB
MSGMIPRPTPARPGAARGAGSLRLLRDMVTSEPRLVAESSAALLLGQMLALLPALAFSIVIDKVVANQAVSTMVVVAAALVLAAACESVFSALRRSLLSELRRRVSRTADGTLFDGAVALASVRPTVAGGRALADRLERALAARETLVEAVDAVVVAPLLLAAIFALMLHLDLLLAGAVAAASAAHAAILFAMRAPLAAAGRGARDAAERGRAAATDVAEGLATIRTLGAAARARAGWLDATATASAAADRLARLRWAIGAAATVKNRALFVAVLAIGASEVIAGRITVGGLVAFAMLLRQFSAAFETAIPLWQRHVETGGWVDEIESGALRVAATRPAVSLGHAVRGGVGLTRVAVGHDRAPDLFAGVDLAIRPGETVGVAGAAGSGKSALLAVMAGLIAPRRGMVSIDGHDLASLGTEDLRRSVRLVEQEPRLFRGSVLDNLRLGDPEADFATVERAVRLAGAHAIVQRLPGQYACPLDERRRWLSPGERQRLCFARALIACPPVLLIDEPGAAIACGEESEFAATLATIRIGRTIVLATSSPTLLASMDRVIAIRDGRVAELTRGAAG